MKHELKFNICGLETWHLTNKAISDLDARIKDRISTHLSYSCRCWAHHLRASVLNKGILLDLKDFLSHHLLFWLEGLSIMDQMPMGSPALVVAGNWASVREKSLEPSCYSIGFHQSDEETVLWTEDAGRFLSTFRYPISESDPFRQKTLGFRHVMVHTSRAAYRYLSGECPIGRLIGTFWRAIQLRSIASPYPLMVDRLLQLQGMVLCACGSRRRASRS
jgi:hypothetical protein